jgi:hypothetical protein
MKRIYIFCLIFCGLLFSANFASALTYVDGYYKGNEFIQGHYRYDSNDIKDPDNTRTIIIKRPAEKTDLEKISEEWEELRTDLSSSASESKSTSFCAAPPLSGCQTESDLGRTRALCSASGTLGSPMCPLESCQAEIKRNSELKESYNECVSASTSIRSSSYNKVATPTESELNNICEDKYGHRSFYDRNTDSCGCEKSSWMYKGECQISWLVCIDLLGKGVKAPDIDSTEMSCSCSDGYEMREVSKDNFICRKIRTDSECVSYFGKNTVAKGDMCDCIDGYEIKEISTGKYSCEEIEQQIKPSESTQAEEKPIQLIGSLAKTEEENPPKTQPIKTEQNPNIQKNPSQSQEIIQNKTQPIVQTNQPVKKSFLTNILASVSTFFRRIFKF